MRPAATLLIIVLLSFAVAGFESKGEKTASPPPSAPRMVITVQDGGVLLRWTTLPGEWEYAIYASTSADMSNPELLAVTRDSVYLDPWASHENQPARFYRVIVRLPEDPLDDPDYHVIESFEEPITLTSYSTAEDQEPNAWDLVGDGAESPLAHSLELNGNTWKRQAIDPLLVSEHTVWRLLTKTLSDANIQGFGIADSANEMWYQIWGREAVDGEAWNAAYTGWYPEDEWCVLDLPIAEDWQGRFGYLPRVLDLLYANDCDGPLPDGVLRIDEIRDLTLVYQPPPEISIVWSVEGSPTPDSVSVSFSLSGIEAGHEPVEYFWTLGDGSYARAPGMIHNYAANGCYDVVLRFRDAHGRAGWAAAEVVCGSGVSPREFTFISVGDVMIARRYESSGIIGEIGAEGIYEGVRDLLMADDLAMCNLECPFTLATDRHPTKEFTFKGRPEYLTAIPYAGFDFCALGNNHNMDYMYPGMVDTKFALDSLGLLSTGAGFDDLNAREPEIYSLNGVSAAVLSYCNRDGVQANEQPFLYATRSRPGFAMWNRTQIEQSIPLAGDLADVVIVQSHSGTEYATEESSLDAAHDDIDMEHRTFELIPDTSDIDLRRYAVDQGADIVINHHPHVLQGIEIYNGKVIAHSMGNFAFDQQFPETMVSMALRGRISAVQGIYDLEVVPVYIEGYLPRPAQGYLAERILDYVSDLSRPMETMLLREPGDLTAKIVPASGYHPRQVFTNGMAALEVRNDTSISAPQWIADGGYPVRVSVPDSLTDVQVRVGRAVFWRGNFEDEGAQPWLFNSETEGFDSEHPHSGERCGMITRATAEVLENGTLMTYRIPYDSRYEHSMLGWISTVDGNEASLNVRFYPTRSTGGASSSQRIGPLIVGSTPWTMYWENLEPPANALFYNLWFSTYGNWLMPAEARFDDIELIRWEAWQPLSADVPFPSNVTHVQFRCVTARDSIPYRVRVEWQPVDDLWPVGG